MKKMRKIIGLAGVIVAAGGLAFAGSTATVYQDGDSHYAQVYQTGGDNALSLRQTSQKLNPVPILTGSGAYIEQYGNNTITGSDYFYFVTASSSEQAGNNWASIYQSGANYLEFYQYSQVGDYANNLAVNQVGDNMAYALTYGDGNGLEIGQNGSVNYAIAYQVNIDWNNYTLLPAFFNTASIDQNGAFNTAGVIQLGNGNAGSVYQNGEYNYGVVYVEGDNNVSSVALIGNGNNGYVDIYGSGNTADISTVNGDWNFASIAQFGDANAADIAQSNGDYNWASVAQYNGGNTASVTQNGNFNEAFISQGY